MKAARMLKSQSGFSLIELMIVVAIIGILASIAVPNFKKFQVKARQSEAKSALTSVYTAEKAFHGEWNSYRGDFRDIGYAPEGSMRYNVGFTAIGILAAGISPNFIPSTNGAAVDAVFNTAAAFAAGTGAGFNFRRDPAIGNLIANGALGNCLANTPPTRTAFVASASGALAALGSDRDDVWAVNERKDICNTQAGI